MPILAGKKKSSVNNRLRGLNGQHEDRADLASRLRRRGEGFWENVLLRKIRGMRDIRSHHEGEV